MDANSILAGSSQAFGSRFYGNFNISNDTWETLNLSLDTSQIPFTELTACTYFNASSDISSIVPHIPISSPEMSTTSTTFKFRI